MRAVVAKALGIRRIWAGVVKGAASSDLLLETGANNHLLLETGDFFLLE